MMRLKQTLSGYAVPQKEFFTFQTTDGVKLNGWMMKPVNFSASKKYPVLMYQYSGPGSQQVLDTWGISWETYMASLGYIVVCVDGRGTGGRGEAFEKCTYLKIGVKEAKDQVETALVPRQTNVCGQRPHRYLGLELWRIHDSYEHERRNSRIQSRSSSSRTDRLAFL